MSLNNSKTHTFNVKYTFDTEKSEPKDYKVKIIPNVERDFDYTVNGEKFLYSKTGELTSAFGLKKEQTEFSIVIPSEYGLQKVLEEINAGKTVAVPEDAETNNPYPYRLIVSSYNGKVTYNIDFKLISTLTDITLLKPSIIGVEDSKLLLFDNFTCWDEGVLIGTVGGDVISQLRTANN